MTLAPQSFDSDLMPLVTAVIDLAVACGTRVEKAVRDHSVHVETQKSSIGDLVTALDKSIEEEIHTALRGLLPVAAFVGEESGAAGAAEYTWVVDPIDGTTNVVHGLEYSAVSIGLLRDGLPVAGVIYSIFTRSVFYAVAGRGAWTVDFRTQPATPVRLRVSEQDLLAASLLSFGLPYDRNSSASILEAAGQLFAQCRDLRRQGSAALDLVNIARGATQGHFERDLRPWDLAAAIVILVEAGGKLTDWTGNPVDLSDPAAKINVAASNGLVHDAMVGTLWCIPV